MKLPKLPFTSQNTLLSVTNFAGLNHTLSCSGGEIYDMMNVSSDDYPVLTSRHKRSVAHISDKILGAGFDGDVLYYVTNDGQKSRFFYNGEQKGQWDDIDAKNKFFCHINRFICIFPDKMFFRTEATKEKQDWERLHGEDEEIDVKVCVNKRMYLTTVSSASSPKPTNELNDLLQIGDNITIQNKDSTQSAFGEKVDKNKKFVISEIVEDCGIAFEGCIFLGLNFHDSDSLKVKIKRVSPRNYDELFGSLSVKSRELYADVDSENQPLNLGYVYGQYVGKYGNSVGEDFSQTHSGECLVEVFSEAELLCYKQGNMLYIDSDDFGARAQTQYESIKFSPNSMGIPNIFFEFSDTNIRDKSRVYNHVPDFDFVCAKNNRIYGIEGNTLYVSSLGDPFTYDKFMGTSDDSYALSILTPGEFTGMVDYGGYIHLFKQDRVIRLYGDEPSQFRTYEVLLNGVRQGCSDSLAVVGGILFYISTDGIVAYSGSVPQKISDKLGVEISSGVALCYKNKYYLFSDKAYVFDSDKNMWHLQDCDNVKFTATNGNVSVFFDDNNAYEISGSLLGKFSGLIFSNESSVKSFIVFGDNYEDTFLHKFISKLLYRISADVGTHVKISIKYDDEPCYMPIYEFYGKGEKETFYIPVRPRRCDRYSIKISANGSFKLLSAARELFAGSKLKSK